MQRILELEDRWCARYKGCGCCGDVVLGASRGLIPQVWLDPTPRPTPARAAGRRGARARARARAANAETGGKEKQKLGFLQKYYHKGAFCQEAADDPASSMGTDDIYKRDFNQATGADKVDKSALPKAMQVRGDAFGKIGRTKWTHLRAEDTTFAGGDNVWADARNKRVGELAEKGAGRKQEFQKPKRIDK